MKKLNIIKNILIAFIFIMLTTNVLSIQTSEPSGINKKDVVDEIDRSEIEEDEEAEAPNIDTMIPAFELPVLKEKKKKQKNKSSTKMVKKTTETPSKSTRVNNTNLKNGQLNKTSKNTEKKVKKKKYIDSKKYLKISQIITNDTIVFQNERMRIHRLKGKYIFKYRYKGTIPKNSAGLKIVSENKYIVTDSKQLILEITKAKELLLGKNAEDINVESEENLPKEIVQKRRALEKKYNRGKLIRFSVPSTRLKESDVIYVFGEVQMVSRKKTGPSSSVKKYWLYPLIDVNNSSLLKMSNNKYKVLRKIQ